ncbi:MAG: NAD-dependent epimerase/dehydratase family protein [Balneola sp.]|nr:NAD-dependent epimerase/dehydratase family protein [Balneola sp.]MBO6651933.1 NAD-dependent epimerase/dehydratase family protein [Balneola sp.]MBO6711768.1 NAD-dependent epimerase/dehydratase family protein [Balneola sp.]MBO6799962.1 NAD-dependent epimerase/dehydratase family protein [Balneola sp.]MBO6871207.1 NAD-dependent epimerase/dehydratase family protein [Balneola sp.]
MSKKVLVLGGAGFIGMNIIKELGSRGDYQISIGDNFFRGKMDEQLTKLVEDYNIKVISADFTEASAFNELENDYDYVYMLASVVGVEYTQKVPNELIRINTALILNTLEWVKTTKCKKVLFTSTSECYAGTIEAFDYQVPTPEEVPLCIDDITHPRFTYAVTKMLGESGFMQYSKVYGFECTIVRYHNVYGPRMGFKHVIPQVVQRFLKNEDPFKVYGFDQTRAFNYIDDAVAGTIGAMESKDTNGEILHIGDMESEITIEQLIHYMGGLIGYKGTYERQGAHSGSVSRRCPDTSKAEKMIGYSPNVHWEEGVKKTVEWYVNYIQSGSEVFE